MFEFLDVFHHGGERAFFGCLKRKSQLHCSYFGGSREALLGGCPCFMGCS